MINKKTRAIIICIIKILMATAIVNAADWTQYTPSPTVNNIDRVLALSTGKAFATAGLGTNFLMYNGTWQEVAKPSSLILVGYNQYTGYFDKTSDGKIHLFYRNSTTNYVASIQYNPASNTYTFEQSINEPLTSFECEDTSNICYAAAVSGGYFEVWEITPSTTLILNTTATTAYAIIQSDRGLYVDDNAYINQGAYEWNGVSFVLRYNWAGTSSYPEIPKHIYQSGSKQAFCSLNPYSLAVYNITGNNYYIVSTADYCIGGITAVTSNNFYYSSNTSNIKKCTWGTISCTEDTITPSSISTMDYDTNSNKGWAAGFNGIIYSYGTTGGGTSTLITTVNSNPTPDGTAIIFTQTPHHTTGLTSNITLHFSGGCVMAVNEYDTFNVPSDTAITYNLSTALFNKNQNCTITSTATFSDSSIANGATFNWYILYGSGTTNTTIYNFTTQNADTAGYTNIKAVAKAGTTNAYTGATNSSDDTNILSIDSSIPNSFIVRRHALNPTRSIITSIGRGTDRLYVGTDNDLFVYNGSTSGNANDLNFENNYGTGLLVSHYIWDVAAIDDNYAWTCIKGYTTDSAKLFNQTANDFTQTISADPCKTIYYDSGKDILIIHKDNGGIEIYNQTTMTLISTISGINTLTLSTQDRVDTYGNYLFAIINDNIIAKYNITNTASPTKIIECRTDRSILSIEAINENEIIIGAGGQNNNQIKICDFNNTETLQSGYYVATNIKNLQNNETPVEIQKMDGNGKIHVAQNSNYAIYNYQKSIQTTTTNHPPTIDEISLSTSNACYNQAIFGTIVASDLDNDELTYDYDCTGVRTIMTNNYLYDSFTCAYNDYEGTHPIKIFVSDGQVDIMQTTNVNITDCIAPNQILLRVYDYQTGARLAGVAVTNTNTSEVQVTDAQGDATFTTATSGYYTLLFQKTNYIEDTIIIAPSADLNNIYLRPTSTNGTTITMLTIYTKDANGAPIEGTIVSATDPLTGMSRSAVTDSNGRAILYDMFTGVKILVTALNEQRQFAFISTYTDLTNGQQKTITITMTHQLQQGQFPVTGRGCADTIAGVILCGNLSITGIGSSCTQDSDCISGRCMLSATTYRECSKFNWTICDVNGEGRGNTCYLRHTSFGVLKGIGNFILDYFLYVLLLIAVVVFLLIIRKALSRD